MKDSGPEESSSVTEQHMELKGRSRHSATLAHCVTDQLLDFFFKDETVDIAQIHLKNELEATQPTALCTSCSSSILIHLRPLVAVASFAAFKAPFIYVPY